MDVAEHGTGCIGTVCYEHSALGQLPDEPGVHRSNEELSPFRLLSRALYVIEYPLDLGSAVC